MEKKFEEESPRKKTRSHAKQKPRAPGDKLKTETSAREAMRKKIRHGKARNDVTDVEKKQIRKKQVRGSRAIDRDRIVKASVHKEMDEANEDQNVGTKALNDSMATMDGAIEGLQRYRYSKKLDGLDGGPAVDRDSSSFSGLGGKLGRNARDANLNAGEATGNVSKGSKAQQKKLMQKEFQKTAAKMSEKEAANQFGSRTKRFVDQAEDLVGRLGEWIAEFVGEHPGFLIFLLIVLLVSLIVSSFATSGGLLMSSLGHSTIESSFTADDDQILAVEADYKAKEQELQRKVENIESEYPGYDEYRYHLAEINHNPYELAALLTILYEDYTEAEVQTKLDEIFNTQYHLSTQAVTEIRTRTETRTRTVTEADGSTSTETYEVEVEYEYHILNVTLSNRTMAAVVREMRLTDDEMARYELLVEMLGNKGMLFARDPYAAPDPGDYGDYDIPAEALTDTSFANMVREAEKYLGYPYVWGGSSPSTSFDCSGYVSWVINHCGNGWNVGRQTANGLLGCCSRVSRDAAKPGDLVFFQGTYDTAGASHVGIYVGNGMMIHCGNPIQYTSINTNYWRQHFYTFGRIR